MRLVQDVFLGCHRHPFPPRTTNLVLQEQQRFPCPFHFLRMMLTKNLTINFLVTVETKQVKFVNSKVRHCGCYKITVMKIFVFIIILISFPFSDCYENGRNYENIEFSNTLQVPYVVSIQRRVVGFERHVAYHWCTGCIIRPDLVMTSAHCVVNEVVNPATKEITYETFDPRSFSVVAGLPFLPNRLTEQELPQLQKRQVQIIFANNLDNKLHYIRPASLKLKAPFRLGANTMVNRIPIAKIYGSKVETPSEMLAGLNCITFEWNKPSLQIYKPFSLLRTVNLTVATKEHCTKVFQSINSHRKVHREQVCTNPGATPCNVDPGAPLVCNNHLAGIADPGSYCKGEPGIWQPAVYDERQIQKPDKQTPRQSTGSKRSSAMLYIQITYFLFRLAAAVVL